MFGDFMQQFGLQFPFQTVDTQGGMLGQNTPQGPQLGSTFPGTGTAAAPATPPAPQASPAAGVGGPSPPPTAPSPLASPLSPGQAQLPMPAAPEQSAPAAGVGSQFGKPAA